jgi:hypothetical protein
MAFLAFPLNRSACRIAAQVFLGATLAAKGLAATPAADAPAADAPAADGAAEPVAAPVAADELAALIRQLDNDRFAVREAAQQRLQGLGAAALADVGREASAGSLESSTRAVSILLQWSLSDDSALSLGALEQLAALTNRPAESAMAANRLADVRERAAMEQIVELGGRVEYDRQVPVFTGTNLSLQVIIGPKWTGGVDGLRYVADVRRATTLSFYSSAVSGDEAAPELTALSQVQRVEFYGTKLSPDAEERLRKSLPHAMVDVRGGARLGIAAGQPAPGGAQVGTVDPGTAAEKAGLMPGDIITEIEGVAVADFESLTREIAKCSAGDSIMLKVLRQTPVGQLPTAPIEMQVTFARWGDEDVVNPNMPNPLSGSPVVSPFGGARVIINRR